MSEFKPNNDLIISLNDLVDLIKKKKKFILFFSFLFALLSLSSVAFKPVKYLAEGTFRDKGKPKQADVKSILDSSISKPENEILSLLKTNKLLDELIDKFGLQINITPFTQKHGWKEHLKNNMKIEWAVFKKKTDCLIDPYLCELKASRITYQGELQKSFVIKFIDDKQFIAFEGKTEIGSGKLNVPFTGPQFSFVLQSAAESSLAGQRFAITLYPKNLIAKSLVPYLNVEAGKEEKSLIKISFTHHNREFAAAVVNELMHIYQNFQQRDADKFSQQQLAYLQKKQEEALTSLMLLLDSHASVLASGLATSGFVNTQSQIDFFAKANYELQHKLRAMELESKKIETALNQELSDLVLMLPDSLITFKDAVKRIKELGLQRDTIALALHKKQPYEAQAAKTDKQAALLQAVASCCSNFEKTLQKYQNNEPIDDEVQKLGPATGLVQNWIERLNAQKGTKEGEIEQKSFLAYLENQIRLYHVYAKILQDRLVNQYELDTDFEGLDLAAATELYLAYTKRLDRLEAELRLKQHVLEKLHTKEIDYHSLETFLTDNISKEVFKRAAILALALQDQENRTQKEQERLKTEMALNRDFLKNHVEQMSEMLQIEQTLGKEKIGSLQQYMLEMLNLSIGIAEKHVRENLASLLNNLQIEKALVEQHLADNVQKMETLPYRWASEQLIQHKMSLNKAIVEETTKLVESKNVALNLDLSQSAPLDYAQAPIFPESPKLLFFAVLGMAAGAFLGLLFAIGKSLYDGIDASKENLVASKQAVAGYLNSKPSSHLSDRDLETMRKLSQFCAEKKEQPQKHCLTCCLMLGEGPDYSKYLTEILAKKGGRGLLLYIDFDGSSEQNVGLLPYLEAKSPSLGIQKGEYADKVIAGGFTRFSTEILTSAKFKTLLAQLASQYDWIFAVTNSKPTADKEYLLRLFDTAIISLKEEKLLDLVPYMEWSYNHQQSVNFIFIT